MCVQRESNKGLADNGVDEIRSQRSGSGYHSLNTLSTKLVDIYKSSRVINETKLGNNASLVCMCLEPWIAIEKCFIYLD